jgi:hypothetical protein
MRIALLHGFALRRTQRPDEGLAAWRKALAHPRLARGVADLETLSTRSAMEMIVLRGVAGEVDDAFVDQITRYLMKRLGGAGGAEQILKQFPIKADTLRDMWRSPRGLETAELTARGDLLQRDQVKRQLMLYASYLVSAGALDQPTPDEEELLWSVAKHGYESYVADDLSLATFLQLGLAWKGVPPPLGWSVVFLGVPTEIRGGVAYFLARRLERREQARPAVTLYRMARDAAGEDATLQRLADEGLRRLVQ